MTEKTIFFSYSRDDSEFVLNLAKELRTAGANVWLDQLDIKPGTRWDKSIETALDTSKTVLVVLSNKSVASHNVMDEVSYALEEGKTVIPVLLEQCDVPFRLRRFQFADFSSSHEKGIKTLIAALGLEPKVAEKLSSDGGVQKKTAVTPPPKVETPKETSEKAVIETKVPPIKEVPKQKSRAEVQKKSKLPLYIIVGVAVILEALAIGGVFSSDTDPKDERRKIDFREKAKEEPEVIEAQPDGDELRKQLMIIAAGIQFETSKPNIKDSEKEIKALVQILTKFPELKISITCHTDSVGSERINMVISQKRADFVKNTLIKHGIAANRITAEGYGESKPIGDNATAAGRAQNRRVEISIVK